MAEEIVIENFDFGSLSEGGQTTNETTILGITFITSVKWPHDEESISIVIQPVKCPEGIELPTMQMKVTISDSATGTRTVSKELTGDISTLDIYMNRFAFTDFALQQDLQQFGRVNIVVSLTPMDIVKRLVPVPHTFSHDMRSFWKNDHATDMIIQGVHHDVSTNTTTILWQLPVHSVVIKSQSSMLSTMTPEIGPDGKLILSCVDYPLDVMKVLVLFYYCGDISDMDTVLNLDPMDNIAKTKLICDVIQQASNLTMCTLVMYCENFLMELLDLSTIGMIINATHTTRHVSTQFHQCIGQFCQMNATNICISGQLVLITPTIFQSYIKL